MYRIDSLLLLSHGDHIMLASANAAVGGVFTVPLQARGRSRVALSGSSIKNGIGTLRATGASPGALSGHTAFSSDGGVLSQFNTQARGASTLTAGVRTVHRLEPASSTGVMQSRQMGLMDRMRRVNMGSSLLQATTNPLRTQGGFGIKPMTSGLSLLG